MNREIKFRAWENDVKYMNNSVRLTQIMGECFFEVSEGFGWIDVPKEYIMQYTGLSDTNGVEIYEGDILKITNTARFCQGENFTCFSEIKLLTGHPYVWPQPVVDGRKIRYGAQLLFSGMTKYIGMRGVATEDVEIVGNVYEDANLLEGADE